MVVGASLTCGVFLCGLSLPSPVPFGCQGSRRLFPRRVYSQSQVLRESVSPAKSSKT